MYDARQSRMEDGLGIIYQNLTGIYTGGIIMSRWVVRTKDSGRKVFSSKTDANAFCDKRKSEELMMKLTPYTPQRCTIGVRRQFMLNVAEPLFYNGIGYRVIWKNLGVGVHEARLEEIK